MNSKEYALIVAGGKGTRLKSQVPKQFLELSGLPVLMHTIDAFFRYAPDIAVILVLPESDINTWHSLCAQYNHHKSIILQRGGETRFQSVRNGLQKIEGDGLVAIHDGVRPLVTEKIIAESFKLARIHNTAIASVPLKESIRRTQDGTTKAVDRSQFKLIQTPQTFKVSLIKDAYQLHEDLNLTDDASVAEKAGIKITLFEGSYENIKITTPEDLIVAKALLESRQGI
jgi:2-C-methyl-D-erythritol 4-phosphate cytidylyltransferase